MSQIRTNRLTHNRQLRRVPTEPGAPAMHFQAHEGPDRQQEMAAHRQRRAENGTGFQGDTLKRGSNPEASSIVPPGGAR